MKNLKKVTQMLVFGCSVFLFLLLEYSPSQANDTTTVSNVNHLCYATKELGKYKAKDEKYIVANYLKYVGINSYANYCASFVSWCFAKAGIKGMPKSAVAQNFITKKSIPAKDVLNKKVKIPAGSLVIWKYIGSWRGHIGFVSRDWIGANGETIEGNTTDVKGNSGAIAKKKRTISLHTSFRITHFTLIISQN